MRGVRSAVALLVAIAAGTWLGGWWAVPLLTAWWGWSGRAAGPAALAAALAWGGLLWLQPSPGMTRLGERLAALGGVPVLVVWLLPLGCAALLGWSAARLLAGLRAPRG